MNTDVPVGDYKVVSWLQGPRWAGGKDFLIQSAMRHGINLEILEENKGLIRTTIYYKAWSSDKDRLESWNKMIIQSVKEYNK